ncbi:MAG: C69 family dipeptidase [Candidatus Omnitrophota bacterium]
MSSARSFLRNTRTDKPRAWGALRFLSCLVAIGVAATLIGLTGERLYAEKDRGFTICAGKNVTENNAVMVAHNEDQEYENMFVNMHKLPLKSYRFPRGTSEKKETVPGGMAPKTYGYLWVELPGLEFGDSYMNENGVVITSNAAVSREDKAMLTNNGIGFMLQREVAEQAMSARHAVALAGQLIYQYGFSASGRTYVFADPSESWVFHAVKGKHWVAQRVPDDQVVVVANRYVIERVYLNDKQNFMGSPDIIVYAIRRGWYNPRRDGEFNFAKAYSAPENYHAYSNILRQWRGVSLFSKSKYKPDALLPFSFHPKDKVSEMDLFRVLRDHYEGTDVDSTRQSNQSPNDQKFNTICNEFTQYAFVAELREDLPAEFSNLMWMCFSRPDTNAFSPWYVSIEEPPHGYTFGNSETALKNHFKYPKAVFAFNMEYAFWYYLKLTQEIDRSYRTRIKVARKEWENFEDYAVKMQRKMEKEFDYMVKTNKHVALKHITNYVEKLEYRKWFLATELVSKTSSKK